MKGEDKKDYYKILGVVRTAKLAEIAATRGRGNGTKVFNRKRH